MKTFKVEIPEGFEIDKDKSTFDQIVFKEIKKELPKSWKELGLISGYCVNLYSEIEIWEDCDIENYHKNFFATKEQAEASIALAQLSQLKKVYNGDWEAKWEDDEPKYVINFHEGKIRKEYYRNTNNFLSFKDKATRDLFFENFRDLILKAKPLMS